MKQNDVTKGTGIKNTTLSNYENGITEPDTDTFLQLCEFYELDYTGILAEAYGLSIQGEDFKIKPSEIEYVKKYRFLIENSPEGAKMVDAILDREYKITEQMQTLKSNYPAIIEFHDKTGNAERLLEYFRSSSAGTGVFILGNEALEQISIPNTPENQDAEKYFRFTVQI